MMTQRIESEISQVLSIDKDFFDAHPEQLTGFDPRPIKAWKVTIELRGEHVASLNIEGQANVFTYCRALIDGLDSFEDGQLVSVVGRRFMMRPATRQAIAEGRLWVNVHNNGYPYAFVIAAREESYEN
jgi:hypothetical protein